jgi:hypothetical protein
VKAAPVAEKPAAPVKALPKAAATPSVGAQSAGTKPGAAQAEELQRLRTAVEKALEEAREILALLDGS